MDFDKIKKRRPVQEVSQGGYFRVEGDEDEQEFSVVKGSFFVSSYGYGPYDYYKKEEAKAAAQAECARLNAEYRKELK